MAPRSLHSPLEQVSRYTDRDRGRRRAPEFYIHS